MKTGDKVTLRLDLVLFAPQQASAPRTLSGQKQFKQGDVFEFVSLNGENATVKDSEGNFWTVLMQFLGLVQEVSQVNENTTIGEGVGLVKRIVNWIAARFKKKK